MNTLLILGVITLALPQGLLLLAGTLAELERVGKGKSTGLNIALLFLFIASYIAGFTMITVASF